MVVYPDTQQHESLEAQLVALTHQLAGMPSGTGLALWKEGLLYQLLEHPDVAVRSALAECGSLALLRLACVDDDPAVRLACTFNPYAVDREVQCILARDRRPEIVEALIHNIDLGREAVEIIARGPHVGARHELAERALAPDLVDALLRDDDDPAETRPGTGLTWSATEWAA